MLSLFLVLFMNSAEAHPRHHHQHAVAHHYRPAPRPGFRLVWNGYFWVQVVAPPVVGGEPVWISGHYRNGHWIPGHWSR